MKNIFRSRPIILLIRLFYILILYALCRLLFFLFNHSSFNTSTIELIKINIYGLRFDLSAIFFINILYIILFLLPVQWLQRGKGAKFLMILFISINAIGLLLNCIDFAFFKFIFRRMTWDVIKGSLIGDDFTSMFFQYVKDFWYVLIIWIGLLLILIYLYKKVPTLINNDKGKIQVLLHSLLNLIISLSISVILFRGGLQLRPISIVTAGEYTTSENIPLILNTPFSIFTTFQMNSIQPKNYFSEEKCKKNFNPVLSLRKDSINDKFIPKNIVIIIVESLSEEYIGKLNKNKNHTSYTPFLDSLIDYCYYSEYSFANAKRSIEGIPAVSSGLPALTDDAFLTSTFSGNKISSLPMLLKPFNYYSAFFHGGKNGTMNFDSYASSAGYEKYFGKNEYNNDKDFDGEWGIFDEEFLQFAASKMNSFNKPFISTIFTLSSHHPYTIPQKHKGQFKKGTLEIHESIGYTDFSLKRFFDTLKKYSWFDNTLFVITADHASIAESTYYKNSVGIYAVPILFYQHNSKFIGKMQKVTQQIDIIPTILDNINYPYPFVSFGRSVFDTLQPHFAITYFSNTYQLIKGDFVFHFSNDKAKALYNYKSDSELKNNLLLTKKNTADSLEIFTKSYIQQFYNRMIKNQLTLSHE